LLVLMGMFKKTWKHPSADELSAFCDADHGAQKEETAKHLAVCAECEARVKRWQLRKELFSRLPRPEPSEEFVNRVRLELARIEESSRQPAFLPPAVREWMFPSLGFVCSMLLLFGAHALNRTAAAPPTIDGYFSAFVPAATTNFDAGLLELIAVD